MTHKHHISERVLDLLYPPRCPFCGRLIPQDACFCKECQKKLPFVREPVCRICGRPVLEGDGICDDCLATERRFDGGGGLLLYNDMTRPALYDLKYRGRADIGRLLGRSLYDFRKDFISDRKIDGLVPVPVHRKRKRERGYDQAEVIARSLADASGLPLITDAVVRRGETGALKDLTREERRAALASAFAPGPRSVTGRSILIIDDIYTSGATVDAVAGVLKDGGAAAAYFLVICIGGAFMVRYK